jgi:hypothetical protein
VVLWVVFWVVFCFSAPALADPLADARRQYDAVEYDRALATLAEASRVAVTPQQRAQVFLLEGFVLGALGRTEEALRKLGDAIRLQPTLSLSADTPPKIRRLFEHAAALERTRREHHARLRLTIGAPELPPVAHRPIDLPIVVEGSYVGLTGRLCVRDLGNGVETTIPLSPDAQGTWRAAIPAELVLEARTLVVRVELLDEGEGVATAPPRAAPPLSIVTPAHAASLEIRSPQRNGHVWIDGVDVGRTPLPGPRFLAAGPHEVRLSVGVSALTQRVLLAPGDTSRVAMSVTGPPPQVIARYAALALGGALVITGGVLYDQADRAGQAYAQSVALDPATGLPTTEYSRVRHLEDSERSLRIASITLLSVGAVLAVVGGALFATGRKGGPKRAAFHPFGSSVRF